MMKLSKLARVMGVVLASLSCTQLVMASTQESCPATSSLTVEQKMERFLDPAKYPDFYLTCGHRGMWYRHPENSSAAIEEAVRLGIDCVENDIRRTKDGYLVIFHDKEVSARLYDPATGKPAQGKVADLTWDQISKLRYLDRDSNKTNYPVLSFGAFLAITNDKIIVNHEDKTKDPQVVRQLIMETKQMGRLNQSIFKGRFTYSQFKQIIDQVVTEKEIIFTPVIFEDTPNYKQVFDEYFNAGFRHFELVIQKPNSPLLAYVNKVRAAKGRLGQFDVVPETGRGSFWVGKWRDPASTLIGYDYRSDWDFLIDVSKADFIISDRPCLMIQYLEKRGKRKIDPEY